ncbi:MAG TPA: hypothetical protein VHF51_16260 [Solirubrobacteraceae bacterium]|nr:hypothetical protein [Solirubrobacteraceae bacterium]
MRWPRGATSAAPESEWVGWREADLRVRKPTTGLRAVRALAWATALTALVVLLMEIQRDPDRCHPNCFDGSDHTFEAGHVWTAYPSSWQWEAQLVLGWGAFLVALGGLYVAGRRTRWQTVASLGLALALLAAWIVWVTLQPSPVRMA